jgi:hypothetical protein
MSGCIIAKWEDARHARCVGHVGTVDGNARTNELVKTTFDRNMPANTTGFNPALEWDFKEMSKLMGVYKATDFKCLALVTRGGEFYSIAMMQLGVASKNWVSGGIKLVKPMNYSQLHAKFTSSKRVLMSTNVFGQRLQELDVIIGNLGGPQQLSQMIEDYHRLSRPKQAEGFCAGRPRLHPGVQEKIATLEQSFKQFGGADVLRSNLVEYQWLNAQRSMLHEHDLKLSEILPTTSDLSN